MNMKRVVFAVAMFLIAFAGYSQTEDADLDKKLRFGFFLGENCSNLQTIDELPVNTKISNGLGFSLGVLMDYSISDNLIFSHKAGLSFNHSKVISEEQSDYKVLPISLDIMTHMVYRFGEKSFRPYLLFGPNFKYPLSEKPKSSTEFSSSPDLAIDFGIGVEKHLKYFVISPELRYSLGLLDINENPTIKSLNFHNVTLAFNFK